MPLVLQLLPGEFAVARLAPDAAIPAWADSRVFSAITRTADELSILCPAAQVPADVKHEAGWAMFKFQGPFEFTLTGVLASVLTPLAAAKLGILATSTFDTDYVFVKQAHLDAAIRTLESAGHTVQKQGRLQPAPIKPRRRSSAGLRPAKETHARRHAPRSSQAPPARP